MAARAGERKRKSKLDGGGGAHVHVPAVRQELQAVVDAVHAPADTHRLASVSVPVLRQTLPPEVGHEETHVHPHRYAAPATAIRPARDQLKPNSITLASSELASNMFGASLELVRS